MNLSPLSTIKNNRDKENSINSDYDKIQSQVRN